MQARLYLQDEGDRCGDHAESGQAGPENEPARGSVRIDLADAQGQQRRTGEVDRVVESCQRRLEGGCRPLRANRRFGARCYSIHRRLSLQVNG